MAQYLNNKRILLGVTGSIAAYKSADLVRRLRDAGAIVRVAMTENAARFITPLTMQAVSGFPVHDELFDLNAEAAMGHIELARWADLILIAPATADFMARLAHGQADDLLSTLCLAARGAIAVAPAMNQAMWKHTLTQENVQALREHAVFILDPADGSQACGDIGPGRMLEPVQIVERISAVYANGALAGLNVVVTAGPTHEALDPIRYLTNGSTGKMGYALAEAASEAGANVTLISGPVTLKAPSHIACKHVTTAAEMHAEVMKNIAGCDIFLAVAAVSDYCVDAPAQHKLHKSEASISIQLTRTPDIAASVGQLPDKPFMVGFAAETEHLLASARAKRERKNMDMIIANHVGGGRGMGSDDNEVTIITATTEKALPLMPKQQLARQIISEIAVQFKQQGTS